MIDHVGLKVADVEASREFYARALAPLGYAEMMMHEISGVGFGRDGKPDFWIKAGTAGGPVHLAFGCAERSIVDEFHNAAILAGGTDDGAPGLRAEYHPTYYGAFVLDLDGNSIEAVCHFEQ